MHLDPIRYVRSSQPHPLARSPISKMKVTVKPGLVDETERHGKVEFISYSGAFCRCTGERIAVGDPVHYVSFGSNVLYTYSKAAIK